MIVIQKFMAPLRDCKDLLTPKDHERIFLGNEVRRSLSIGNEVKCSFVQIAHQALSALANTDLMVIDLICGLGLIHHRFVSCSLDLGAIEVTNYLIYLDAFND